jgi:tRNA pseudouridine38-40 synthase
MANYKLTISYDGTYYCGFQKQGDPNIPTIQGELHRVLCKIFASPLKIYVAGRTDTGVHAIEQVISFKHERVMKPYNLRRAANGLLNGSITINKVEFADDSFGARYSATCRHYIYIVDNAPHPTALWHNRAYWYPLPLNVERMAKAIKLFEGMHDFRNFAKSLEDIESTGRNIQKAELFAPEMRRKITDGEPADRKHDPNNFHFSEFFHASHPHNIHSVYDKPKYADPGSLNPALSSKAQRLGWIIPEKAMRQESADSQKSPVQICEEQTGQTGGVNQPSLQIQTPEAHNSELLPLLEKVLIPQGTPIYFYFKGEAFLHSMVRLMVSSLIQLGRGKISEEDIMNMLNCNTPRIPKVLNIPGKGLYLVKVDY